jgi:hypothetical protein
MQNTRLALLALSVGAMMYRDGTPGTDGSGGNGAPAASAPAVVIPEGMKAQVFHFRKEKIKDSEGKEIEVFKHPSVTIPIPVPTVEMVKEIFTAPTTGDNNRGSEQKFILDLISDAFYSQAREQINNFREGVDNPKEKLVTADVIDYSKLTITALANMPASERGSKVSDEDMAAFLQDYVAVMPQASGKDASKIKAQADILERGLRSVKTDKKVLNVMNDLLTLWAANTANLEEHQEVYDMLTGRIKKWVAAEPRNVLESIM